MVADMSYNTLYRVVESWEEVRRIPNFDEKAGVMLFKKLFELEPETKMLFGFEKDTCVNTELTKSVNFVRHSRHFVKMFDKAVEMLGPDVDLLTDILLDLGAKHASYGVKPEYYPSMGKALIEVVKELLGESFDTEVQHAWFEMYGAISYDMIRAQQKAHVRPAEPHLHQQLSNVSV